MILRSFGFPRFAVVPLLYGIIIGLIIGKWWFWTSYDLYPTAANPNITCLVIAKGNSLSPVSTQTWLKKCDNYLIVKFNRTKGAKQVQYGSKIWIVAAENGWSALCQTFHLLPRPVQWLLIVPDTLLVIIENLKQLVLNRDWNGVAYIGHPLRHYMGEYNALAAGILMSNASISLLLGRFPDARSCSSSGKYWNNEDVYLGSYLRKLGVRFEDTRDEKGRGRFHGFNVNSLLYPGKIFKQTNYYKNAVFPTMEGFDCCSPQLITIDTSDADHALVQFFLLYGINAKQPIILPKADKPKTPSQPRWISDLRAIGYTGPTANMSSEQYYEIWAQHLPPDVLAEKLAKAAKET